MEVTRVDDHVTTASISAAQAIDFGISDSPEFFQILSSTLYSDQILAVVRETLCNAWDAHLEFGCSDKAMSVTLNDDYLIIRDFGPGIAPEMIGPIYGTYGGSTKAKNGQVTGGFGLGCKSPFAYVDDFEVTSYHKGLMTIYRMTKSNAEVGGKPSIVPMVSNIPTKESGIQVKIAMKNKKGSIRFNVLIQRIIQNGGMLCDYSYGVNPVPFRLETLPFDDMTNGYMITQKQLLENDKSIVVRYGNVIYPIEPEETYNSEYRDCLEFLNRISGRDRYGYSQGRNWKLVLQAAPNTVSVTPSRETLSNQKHTLEAIKSLMGAFLKNQEKQLELECYKLLKESVNNQFSKPVTLLDNFGSVFPGIGKIDRGAIPAISHYSHQASYNKAEVPVTMTKVPEFARTWVISGYPSFKGFKKTDLKARIKSLIGFKFGGDRGVLLLKSYFKAWEKEQHQTKIRNKADWRYANKEVASPWFHQSVLYPVIKGFNEDNGLDISKLYVYDKNHKNSGRGRGSNVVPAKNYFLENWQPDLNYLMPFTRPILILSFNKVDVDDGDADKDRGLKLWYGQSDKSLVYVTPRNPAKVEIAREYFQKLGYHVVDLTGSQHEAYLQKREEAAASPRVTKPKIVGIPMLSSCVHDKGNYTNQWDSSTVARIKEPEMIITESRKNHYNYLDSMWQDVRASNLVIKLFGDKTGVVSNVNQARRYYEAGAKDWYLYICEKLLEAFKNLPGIAKHFPMWRARKHGFNAGYGDPYRSERGILNCIYSDVDLQEYFGLVDNRTEEEKDFMDLYEIFHGHASHRTEMKEIMKMFHKVPESKEIQFIYDKVKTSANIRMLDEDHIWFCLNPLNETPTKQRELARDLLLQCIEG